MERRILCVRKVCTMLNWLLSKKDFDALIADPSTTLSKLVTVMRTCEDIELQQALVELLFRVSPRGDKERQEFASTYQIPLQFTKIALDNFVDDVREFLGALNESNEAGKRWPKSYRVSVVAYGGNPKCECKPISTFWLDFLKTGILVHFELNGRHCDC
ncbi:hypothetical protein BC829DRAFT_264615 [Chytridium lagenaria]|nr:hypothetical protein BC829DRAFT_264615 [Chytridium lagenaria]